MSVFIQAGGGTLILYTAPLVKSVPPLPLLLPLVIGRGGGRAAAALDDDDDDNDPCPTLTTLALALTLTVQAIVAVAALTPEALSPPSLSSTVGEAAVVVVVGVFFDALTAGLTLVALTAHIFFAVKTVVAAAAAVLTDFFFGGGDSKSLSLDDDVDESSINTWQTS